MKVWDVPICIFAFTLMIYVWYSCHQVIYFPWIRDSSENLGWIFFLIVTNLISSLAVWSFLMAIFTNPGKVEDCKGCASERSIRFCSKCGISRPPRAHHCSNGCDTCILKMDHHCPWIANCVGHRNHGHFLRFVFYTWLACALFTSSLIVRLFLVIKDELIVGGMVGLWEGGILMFNSIFLCALWIMLTILFCVTFKNVLQNCTSIEQCEVEEEQTFSRKTNQKSRPYPFDLGVLNNLKVVLGKRIWLWPFPLPADWQLSEDGYNWPTNGECEAEDWPYEDVFSPTSSYLGDSDTSQRYRRDSEGYIVPMTIRRGFTSNPDLGSDVQ